ncbi:hypothetical protein CALVIDRAFT_542325 [Calocera viscosa TUFC12733]|uniref:Uncharacterized protein n=1 Tax=Calocera viscosa (strain TUFC12733) TaxID=1330018 RepID=A0A167GSS4_CALVF|nr:hypothetical protein CALVIDRAFT_542325 [Calocera viscosa TUFC12733]
MEAEENFPSTQAGLPASPPHPPSAVVSPEAAELALATMTLQGAAGGDPAQERSTSSRPPTPAQVLGAVLGLQETCSLSPSPTGTVRSPWDPFTLLAPALPFLYPTHHHSTTMDDGDDLSPPSPPSSLSSSFSFRAALDTLHSGLSDVKLVQSIVCPSRRASAGSNIFTAP